MPESGAGTAARERDRQSQNGGDPGRPRTGGLGRPSLLRGFVKLALDAGVPIVPIVSVGGQETAIFVSHGDRLAKLLRLDKLLRLKTLPVNLSLPWILNIGDFLGHLPLPAKITVQVMEPIDLRERYGRNPDRLEIYDDITAMMQEQLTGLAAERRL